MHLRWLTIPALLAGLAGAPAALGGSPVTEPVRRVDRMWVVGAPVLDEVTIGLYAWVEDRALQLAAKPGKSGRGTFRIRVRSTADLDLSKAGGFRIVAKSADNNVVLEATTKEGPVRGAVSSKGDITLSDAEYGSGKPAPLYVGPLAHQAAASVVIGRF
ncbi:MAG: hypothetical protein KC933_38560 [Myxococcales bacterium]|nr:hypothetical protein [Myxococcales bacterium]MCB9647351.1 hypothetical protein [Deltaproteobacteria bacterium]